MTGQIKHIAIVTDRYTLLARFYEALFGMWTFPGRVEAAAMAVSDGHVGLNFNHRPPGRQAGLDHFGFEVESVDTVLTRAARFPGVGFLERPSNRPFAGMSMNDPAGNVFDLARREVADRDSVYGNEASQRKTTRRVSHFLLRAMDPTLLADFYSSVFDLLPRPAPDANTFHLSDGTVTMVIAPWNIKDYQGTGIARPAMDHLGFMVESIPKFESDLEALISANTALAPQSLMATAENQNRLKLLETCSLGHWHLTDPDGVLLDVSAD